MARINTMLHVACGDDELRYAMTFVFIKNKFAYATDAHLLVKQSLIQVHDFSSEELKHVEGKLISKKMWLEGFKATKKALKDGDQYAPKFTEEGMKIWDGIHMISYSYPKSDDLKYPECDQVIPSVDETTSGIDSIGINPHLVARLQKAMVPPYAIGNFEFGFIAKNKAIKVKMVSDYSYEQNCGIIMPVTIEG